LVTDQNQKEGRFYEEKISQVQKKANGKVGRLAMATYWNFPYFQWRSYPILPGVI